MLKRIIFYLLVQLFAGSLCIAQNKPIYNMFLEEPVPANGVSVAFNAPVLRWPYQKGKQVKYDIQLSQDTSFSTGSIAAQDLSGAIFNPHQSLAIGRWYWHYRVTGKAWSELKYFNVTAQALPMVYPVAAEFLAKIPLQHPRVLVNDAREDTRALAKSPAAIAIIAEADKVLLQNILTEADAKASAKGENAGQDKKNDQDAIVGLGNRVYQMVRSLCEASLLAHKEAYATKAIAIALEIAKWNPAGISGSRDFTDGMCMYNMALVFDTFYEKLDEQQRGILLKAIKERAGKFYKNWVNNIESKVLSGHVWQLLLNEFFKTSLALYQHEPDAAQWLSYAYELFLAREPVLGGLDGGWAEGAYYFQMNMEVLIEIPDKIKAWTGFDFIKAHPWYSRQADWLIYQFPPGSSNDGYGDDTEALFEPPASYAAFADIMFRLTGNLKYDWYHKALQHPPVGVTVPGLRWWQLIHTGKTKPRTGIDTVQLPMAHLFKEAGVASLHTDPAHAKKDIAVAMRSSPFGAYGHILADQNTFNIFSGGKRLFFRTGYKVAMDDPHRLGWSKHTKSMNGVLINGQGDPYSIQAYGMFTRFLQGHQLAYMKGDASNAYQSTETKENYGVKKFLRHVVLLRPGIVIIYDELESQQDAEWSWLIHSLKNMQLDSASNQFTATIEQSKGVGRLWSSQPFAWKITNKFDVPAVHYRSYKGMLTKEYDDTQWHLKAINREKSAAVRFLCVIQVSQDGKPLAFKEVKQTEGTTKLAVGDWEIEATLSTSLPPQLKVHSLSGKAAFNAYGSDLLFHGQVYKGSADQNSLLAEWVNGKTIFAEAGEEPFPAVR